MILDRHPPPQSRIEPTCSPCMGSYLKLGAGLLLAPVCLPVCCHWLSAFQALLWSQAYDVCHASFLRLFGAISLTAFRISGFGLSVALRGCISRVHGWVFLFCHWSCVIDHHARATGGFDATLGGGWQSRIIITWCAIAFWGSSCVCVFHL